MKAVFLVVVLLLAGCAATVPERVLVPIPVLCVAVIPDEPEWATDALPVAAPLWDLVRALLAERQQRIGYEEQLRAALEACNGPVNSVPRTSPSAI